MGRFLKGDEQQSIEIFEFPECKRGIVVRNSVVCI